MIIGTISEGIVIDHIPAGKAMQIYDYLQLDQLDCEVAIIKNASSSNLDLLGYIDPHITVKIIHNAERAEKFHPQLPQTLKGVLRCKNPRCISSIEQELPQVFRLADKEKGTYRCIYCDTRAEEK